MFVYMVVYRIVIILRIVIERIWMSTSAVNNLYSEECTKMFFSYDSTDLTIKQSHVYHGFATSNFRVYVYR